MSDDRIIRALKRSQDYGIRVKVEDFKGNFDDYAFLDWLVSVKHFFKWKELDEDRKVRFITTKLKGMALVWWKKLQANRVKKEKEKISTWTKMKEKLRPKYLPSDYHASIHHRLLGLC